MKVSELSGAKLDYWVARAEDLEMRPDDATSYRPKEYRGAGVCVRGGGVVGTDYSPSADWSQGGPIIERERITIAPDWSNAKICRAHLHGYIHAIGYTPLIAAMRAFVASKYGEDVPDE